MRYAAVRIADASERVTLQEELENVRHYLYIQNIRYGNTFELVQKIEHELLQIPLFRMLLQPIVENSLFHGYCGGLREGSIRISAYTAADRFVIEVEDDGVGMPEEKVRLLLQPTTESAAANSRRRIGLYNIHKRIQLYYGETYGLEVESIMGKGTIVRASFPSKADKINFSPDWPSSTTNTG